MKNFVALLILMPSLALAQFQQAPAMLPMPNYGMYQGQSPAPSYFPPYPPALGNSYGYGNGYGNMYSNPYVNPYYGSPYGIGGMNGYNPYGNMYGNGGMNSYNPYGNMGMMSPYGSYNPYGGYNQYGYNGMNTGMNNGSLLSGLSSIFAGINLGGLSLGFQSGGQQPCYSCMNGGSMANPMMSPLNFGGNQMTPMNPFATTEAGYMSPAAFVPGGTDRIAGVDKSIVADNSTTDRPGVGPRAPAILPMPSGSDHPENVRKITNEFSAAFNSCAPGCQPVGYGIEGGRFDKNGAKKPSCHWEGLAVDLPEMQCEGTRYKALDGESGKFAEMVQCMRGKMGTVLFYLHKYRDATTDHRNHAHFSNGCVSMGKSMG